MDAFTRAYIECALWSSADDDGVPLDAGPYKLAPETLKRMQNDCLAFQAAAEDKAWGVNMWEYWTNEEAGRDFWLTRNEHGAGFWDYYPEPEGGLAGKLTELARSFGTCELYVGDDGLVYAT